MFYDESQTFVYLLVIFLGLMGFMAVVFTVHSENKQKEKEREQKYKNAVPVKKIEKKAKNDEIIDSLNFMLANGIIDTMEYNKLMVKCLPFMEGK